MKNYAFVTQRGNKTYYRSILDPKDEIVVENGKKVKLKKKIKVEAKKCL